MPLGTDSAAPPAGTDNSFFGKISNAVADTFSAALPIWTAKELDLQSRDQLANPLYTGGLSGRQFDESLNYTGGAGPTGSYYNTPAGAQRASLFQIGGVSIDGTTLIALAAGVVGFAYLTRK